MRVNINSKSTAFRDLSVGTVFMIKDAAYMKVSVDNKCMQLDLTTGFVKEPTNLSVHVPYDTKLQIELRK